MHILIVGIALIPLAAILPGPFPALLVMVPSAFMVGLGLSEFLAATIGRKQ